MDLTLFGYIVGEGILFTVKISSSLIVDDLKKAIKQEIPDLKDIGLELFDVSVPYGDDFAKKVKNNVERQAPLIPVRELSKIFPNEPPEEYIHIAVKLSDVQLLSLKRPAPAHISPHILQRWNNKRGRLTMPITVDELRTLMNTPLLENEKIPLLQSRLDELVATQNNPRESLTPEEANTLFRSSDVEDAILLETVFFTAAFTHPPPRNGTEGCYYLFWDENIRKVLDVLVPSGKSIRNSSEHPAIRKLLPDFGIILDNCCPFRGEEKGPQDPGNPRDELSQKLYWDYGSVPYLLGYYCKGTRLTYVAILKPDQANHEPTLQDLANVDLGTRKGRITNMRWLINLSFLLLDLVNLMPQGEGEFITMQRDFCTIKLTGRHVIKKYTCRDALQKIEHLRSIYHWLEETRVPNIDSVYYISETTIVLQPRGRCEVPKTEKELLEAVFCVLRVLKAIHPALFHRDIRWPNVIRRKDDKSKWFLIDWEDAQKPPTKALEHFASESHSPRVFQDGHGGEVDIWGVGHLITESGVIGFSHKLHKIGRWMKEKSPSAEEAWNQLECYANR